jgi:Tat protein secretion system quality control protein TatD with DNase activity
MLSPLPPPTPPPQRERNSLHAPPSVGTACLPVGRGEGDVILFFVESRPKDVWISLEQVAKLKNLDPNFVSEQTTINASQFFKILFQRKD